MLARTTALEDVKKPTQGLTVFYADLNKGRESGQVVVTPIKKMGVCLPRFSAMPNAKAILCLG